MFHQLLKLNGNIIPISISSANKIYFIAIVIHHSPLCFFVLFLQQRSRNDYYKSDPAYTWYERQAKRMGRKLNLSHLSDTECRQILDVIQRDYQIRQKEKQRIRYVMQHFHTICWRKMKVGVILIENHTPFVEGIIYMMIWSKGILYSLLLNQSEKMLEENSLCKF